MFSIGSDHQALFENNITRLISFDYSLWMANPKPLLGELLLYCQKKSSTDEKGIILTKYIEDIVIEEHPWMNYDMVYGTFWADSVDVEIEHRRLFQVSSDNTAQIITNILG